MSVIKGKYMKFEEACKMAHKLLLEDDFKGFYKIEETNTMWVFYGGNPNEKFYGLRTVFVEKETQKVDWFDINHRRDELSDSNEVPVPMEYNYKLYLSSNQQTERERDLGEYDPPIEVNPNPTIEQIEAAWKVAEKYGAKRVKKITIIDESCFCPVDELYKEKLVITERGIKYGYEPRYLDCNQPRSWSYKTTSEAFKVVFNQIAQRSYDMMKYTDEVYITDIIPTKITVTYEDGHKEKNEMYWFRKEFGDVCETLRGLIPPFADMPIFLDDECDYD